MTDTATQRTPYGEFIKHMENLATVSGLLEKIKNEPRGPAKDKAHQELRQYAFDTYLKGKIADGPYKDIPIESVEKMHDTMVEPLVNFGLGKANESAANLLSGEVEQIVSASGIKAKTLEELVLADVIAKHVKSEDKPIYDSYKNVQKLEAMKRNYEQDEADEQTAKFALNASVRGCAESCAASLKTAGYSTDVQNLGREVAATAAKLGLYNGEKLKEYALRGFDKEIAEAKKAYDAVVGANGNRQIHDAVRDSIRLASKTENSKDFTALMSAIYIARNISNGKTSEAA